MTRLLSTLVLGAVGLFTAYGLLGRQLGVPAPGLWQALAEVRSLEPERSPVLPSDPPARVKEEAPAPEPAPLPVAEVEPAPLPAPEVVIEPARAFVEESRPVVGDSWVEAREVEEAHAPAAADAPASDQDAWAALIRRMLAIYPRTRQPE